MNGPGQKQAAKIASVLTAYLETPDDDGLHAVARRLNALPVYRDLGGTLFLDARGQVFVLEHDSNTPPRLETDAEWRRVAFEQASRKFPELADLISGS